MGIRQTSSQHGVAATAMMKTAAPLQCGTVGDAECNTGWWIPVQSSAYPMGLCSALSARAQFIEPLGGQTAAIGREQPA